MDYCKKWIPLESNPEVFNDLLRNLGGSDVLEFFDILSLDPEAIKLTPRPVLGLILVYPDIPSKENDITLSIQLSEEDIVWLKQTIDNACGLFAILHALCNLPQFIIPKSFLDCLISSSPTDRKRIINTSTELEIAYSHALELCTTSSPLSQEEVEHHYVCFVKTPSNTFVALDGEQDGPIGKYILQEEDDVLSDKAVKVVSEHLRGEGSYALIGLGLKNR